MWVTAYDAVADASLFSQNAGKMEQRRERWLEFHDRATGGIPGLLPLVLDLPVRFTEGLGKQAREQGVFKHSRGWLRGWELTPEETTRLEQLDDEEVVLYQRPTKLFIEVETATNKMPRMDGKRIFILRVQGKPWSLGQNIKLTRYGFPIVPDFGGTAHAYCGSTMPAALGDLLPWFKKPKLEEMLKAYIIKSRVKEADHLMLAQPYSPHLFRQGQLPGPQLLLDVLEKRISTQEAKTAWKRAESGKSSPATQGWLFDQTLPCRYCSDNNGGEEVWKSISEFTSEQLPERIWTKTVSQGQDLACFECRHKLQWTKTDAIIPCSQCKQIQIRTKYDAQAHIICIHVPQSCQLNSPSPNYSTCS